MAPGQINVRKLSMGLVDPFARDATTASIPHQAIHSQVVGYTEVGLTLSEK
jgi:hypothetical protein